jgi:hypothetical protein
LGRDVAPEIIQDQIGCYREHSNSRELGPSCRLVGEYPDLHQKSTGA